MARIARVAAPGCWHHVTQRGNRKQAVFFADADRTMYLGLLRAHCRRTAVGIAGYCLMSNHIHLIAIPQAAKALAAALGRTHADYARWINLQRGETGHLWQNRYYSCPLDEEHQWEALRYVELNPVRAGLVHDASEWPWSSAAAHTGGADRAAILDNSVRGATWTAALWREALGQGIADAALLERIRESTRTGRPAAGEEFIGRLEAMAHRVLRPQKRGPNRKAAESSGQMALGGS